MNGLELTVLALGTVVLAVSMAVIAWRELRPGAEAPYVQTWRDLLGIIVTLSGLAILVVWLWASR